MKFGVVIPCANEIRFLPAVVEQVMKVADRGLILRSNHPFSRDVEAEIVLQPFPTIADPRVEVVLGSWKNEACVRNAGIERLAEEGCDYIFTIDSDEIFLDEDFEYLRTLCLRGTHRAIGTRLYTYWKTPLYRIDPPEFLVAPMVVRSDVRYINERRVPDGVMELARPWCHHLSYVRTDEEMQSKLKFFHHAHEIRPNWFESVWKRWDEDRMLENLHPVFPPHFQRAVCASNPYFLDVLSRHV